MSSSRKGSAEHMLDMCESTKHIALFRQHCNDLVKNEYLTIKHYKELILKSKDKFLKCQENEVLDKPLFIER